MICVPIAKLYSTSVILSLPVNDFFIRVSQVLLKHEVKVENLYDGFNTSEKATLKDIDFSVLNLFFTYLIVLGKYT